MLWDSENASPFLLSENDRDTIDIIYRGFVEKYYLLKNIIYWGFAEVGVEVRDDGGEVDRYRESKRYVSKLKWLESKWGEGGCIFGTHAVYL